LAYRHEIIGNFRLLSLCSGNGTQCIRSQIHIKATNVIPREKAIHLPETESGDIGTQARNQKEKGEEMENSFC